MCQALSKLAAMYASKASPVKLAALSRGRSIRSSKQAFAQLPVGLGGAKKHSQKRYQRR